MPNGQTTEASAQTAYGRSGRSDGGPDERGKIRDAIAPNTESRAPQSETDAPAGQLRTTPTHASTPAKDGQTQVAAARVSAADPSAAAAPGSTIEPTSRAIGSAGKRLAPGAAAQVGEPGGPPSANSSGPTLPGLTQSATRGAGTAPAQTPPSDQPVPIEQVAVHIRKAVKAGQDHIRIRLHPAELGQIDVKLQMSGDGAVKAVIAVDRSETLDLLQRDARGLERSLQDAGLKTDSGSLSFHLRGEGNGDMKGGTGGSGPAGSTQERAHETRSAADAPAPPPPARADRVLDITV